MPEDIHNEPLNGLARCEMRGPIPFIRERDASRRDAEIRSRDGTTSNRCRTIITVVSDEGDERGRYTTQMF